MGKNQEIQDKQELIKEDQTGLEEVQAGVDNVKQDIENLEQVSNELVEQAEQVAKTAAVEPMTLCEDDLPLLSDFIAEAAEHIESAEGGLLELEADSSNADAINLIFRGFHTIKGMAGFLNLTQLGKLAHSAESLLDKGRKGQLKLVGARMDVIFESIDMLKSMLAVIKKAIESDRIVPPTKGLDEFLANIEKYSDENLEIDEIQERQSRQDAADNSADEKPSAGEVGKQPASDEKIKVSTERLDNLINMVGELVIAHSMVEQDVVSSSAGAGHNLLKKVSHQGKIVRELQELSMLMRMVPIRGVFQKMTRLVRDLTKKSGKAAELITTGEETELDRNVVEQISDPLIHMIRNSVDHGIEDKAEREAAGKPAVGRVELKAYHQGGNIVIEITDDGKGLDKERILKKATDNGLIQPNTEMSDSEIFKLIFLPGFSTAAKVTDISGRGVGMDVVKRNIEALRGKVDITSQKGKGTTFIISLPLTMAIIDGQVVRIGTEKYIIPIVSIVSCHKPTKEELSTVQGKGELVNYHGKLLNMVRLYEIFHCNPDCADPTESAVVIVEEDGRQAAFVVDELLGQQQVVIKSLGTALGKVKGISGGAIMGDGRVSLIIDVLGLMEIAIR